MILFSLEDFIAAKPILNVFRPSQPSIIGLSLFVIQCKKCIISLAYISLSFILNFSSICDFEVILVSLMIDSQLV